MADPPSSPSSDQGSVRDRDFTTLLIAAYRDYPELWRVKSKDYFNKNKKAIAMQKIVDALKQCKPDFTVEQLKKRINALRTNFNKDYKHIESMKRSGVAAEGIPEPNAWYYNDLMFIKDQLEIAETESSEVSIKASSTYSIHINLYLKSLVIFKNDNKLYLMLM